jgi:hypothetical protein
MSRQAFPADAFILSRSKVDVSMGGFPGCFEEDVKSILTNSLFVNILSEI